MAPKDSAVFDPEFTSATYVRGSFDALAASAVTIDPCIVIGCVHEYGHDGAHSYAHAKKPRVEVCGHARADLRARQDTITVFECRDCGHSWKEISP